MGVFCLDKTKCVLYRQWNVIQPLEGSSDTGYNMDEPWKHAQWTKPDTEGQILCGLTYLRWLD